MSHAIVRLLILMNMLQYLVLNAFRWLCLESVKQGVAVVVFSCCVRYELLVFFVVCRENSFDWFSGEWPFNVSRAREWLLIYSKATLVNRQFKPF